jgi:hypothetical protein
MPSSIKDLAGAVDMNPAEVKTPGGPKSVEAMIADAVTSAMSRFGNPNCFNCNKPGHRAIDCPTKDAAKSGGASNPKGTSAWRYIGPTNGVLTVTKENVTTTGARNASTAEATGPPPIPEPITKRERESATADARHLGKLTVAKSPTAMTLLMMMTQSQYGIMLPWGE